jgi:hypothetical protein
MVDAARHLLTLQREGSLRLIGATNFNTEQTARMLDAGIPLASMQVQYSLLDRRPSGPMAALCAQSGMQLLCYGTLAGGFLTSAWLGQSEPALESLSNRSLIKYKLVIDDFGGWALFQDLLQALAQDAKAGKVAVDGWSKMTGHDVVDLAKKFQDYGVEAVIYTDIGRDGMLTGVNIDATVSLARQLTVPVIASGGITDLKDVEKLCAVESEGIMGAITGRAVYEGTLNFGEAQKLADKLGKKG